MRHLKENEKKLINYLLVESLQPCIISDNLSECLVNDMNDGNMGSIKFLYATNVDQKFGRELIQKEFVDIDGVPIVVSLDLDDQGRLYELDIWKVDFSAVKRFPTGELE